MVKKNKWNVPKEVGETLVNDKIIEILKEITTIELSELNFLLQNRYKETIFMNNNKNKTILNFIKIVLGGLRYHIEKNKDKFSLSQKGNQYFIQLSDKNTISFDGWILV